MLFLLFFLGCKSYNNIGNGEPSFRGAMVDSVTWYEDANNDVLVMNIINPIPNALKCKPANNLLAPLRPCTMADVNLDRNPADTYEPRLHVQMSTDTFNPTGNAMNAALRIRGNYSRSLEQKSYSIRLDSRTNLFMKQRMFALNKSQSDLSRVRNKLAFDLFRIIPNISSIKVQFINLKINDVDYGLFHQLEAIRREFLINRGWNKDDNLYNTVNFFFKEDSRLALNSEGQPANEALFKEILEIRTGNNHSKLAEMLKAIAVTPNIDDVITKYFNRNNYMTWLAANLVLNNKDTIQHNYCLYNPLYSDTFYFLPWDYDGAWTTKEFIGKEQYGISNWWKVDLHRKFLSVEQNRNDVYALAEELRQKYITDTFIEKKLLEYESSVRPFQSREPDNSNNSDSSWIRFSQKLLTGVPKNIALYKSVIGHPMPFEVKATYNNSILDIIWEQSVDLEGDTIVYDLTVSSDGNFSNGVTTLISSRGMQETSYSENINLSKGSYYIKVISKELNNPGNYQIAYAKVKLNGKDQYGVLELKIP